MKTILALLVVLVASAGMYRRSGGPYITHQHTDVQYDDMGQEVQVRGIDVHNPLDRAVWVYIECEGHLTEKPVGIPGRHTSEITLDGVAQTELCSLNHWTIQVPGKSPDPWRP